MKVVFEGKTIDDAVEKAVEGLHIDRSNFDVNVLSEQKGKVRVEIVLVDDDEKGEATSATPNAHESVPFDDDEDEKVWTDERTEMPAEGAETELCEFATRIASSLSDSVRAHISFRSNSGKLGITLACEDASLVIGRGGKNLDAIQQILNALPTAVENKLRIVLDCDGYRESREEKLIKEANEIARFVKKTGKSRLLEPMNPYERRLVHRTIAQFGGLITESEGATPDAIIKRIKVMRTA